MSDSSTIINGVDYGPLAKLVGQWIGVRGTDTSPDANAEPDINAFIDELSFEPDGPAENAEEQQLVSLRYRHVVRKQKNGKIFHNQVGHWILEPTTGKVMHSLSIPRGVCLLAGGQLTTKGNEIGIEVSASKGDEAFGIVQSPFMNQKAETKAFWLELRACGDELYYREVMSLHIYGKDFEHTDESRLQRITYD